MKRIFDLVFRDLFTSEFSELLDSWALIIAIVPFGALIFCGMYIGQFMMDSTALGVLLMFLFPAIGFACLYGIRKALGAGKGATRSYRVSSAPEEEAESEAIMVVVRIEASNANGKRTMYALRRTDALDNSYLQKGFATSVADLRAQYGATYPDVDWNNIVADPPKNLTASLQREETRPAEPMQTTSR